jgi:hypothetical protein
MTFCVVYLLPTNILWTRFLYLPPTPTSARIRHRFRPRATDLLTSRIPSPLTLAQVNRRHV